MGVVWGHQLNNSADEAERFLGYSTPARLSVAKRNAEPSCEQTNKERVFV
jgi:hypothetical protein